MARKPSSGTAEADNLRQSLRKDMDQLVRDPAHALTRLSASWASSPHRPSPSSDQASDSAQPLATTSQLGVAPTPTAQEFTFDPIAAAGDGLIMTGPSFVEATGRNRGLSTASSFASQLGSPTSGDASFNKEIDAATDAKAGSNSNGGSYIVARRRSVRTSRRRQQLLNCLSKQSVDIAQLRTLAWQVFPTSCAPSYGSCCSAISRLLPRYGLQHCHANVPNMPQEWNWHSQKALLRSIKPSGIRFTSTYRERIQDSTMATASNAESAREDSVCMGYPTSGQWVRARHQRPGNPPSLRSSSVHT